jgi:hypothetical protein
MGIDFNDIDMEEENPYIKYELCYQKQFDSIYIMDKNNDRKIYNDFDTYSIYERITNSMMTDVLNRRRLISVYSEDNKYINRSNEKLADNWYRVYWDDLDIKNEIDTNYE